MSSHTSCCGELIPNRKHASAVRFITSTTINRFIRSFVSFFSLSLVFLLLFDLTARKSASRLFTLCGGLSHIFLISSRSTGMFNPTYDCWWSMTVVSRVHMQAWSAHVCFLSALFDEFEICHFILIVQWLWSYIKFNFPPCHRMLARARSLASPNCAIAKQWIINPWKYCTISVLSSREVMTWMLLPFQPHRSMSN